MQHTTDTVTGVLSINCSWLIIRDNINVIFKNYEFSPSVAGFDPLQSLIDPSLSNVDLNMSLMPSIKQHHDVDDDATINDAPSLSEDFGNYDSHEENDDTFPELNFAQQHSGVPVIHGPSTLTVSTTDSVSTSTPVDYQALPEQQEYPLPSYDEVMSMDSSLNSGSVTHQYPDESKVTYRHKNTT